MEQQGLTRREMIAVMGAGGLALAGLTGSGWPGDEAAAAILPASPATAPRYVQPSRSGHWSWSWSCR